MIYVKLRKNGSPALKFWAWALLFVSVAAPFPVGATPPKKNPGSAPENLRCSCRVAFSTRYDQPLESFELML